MKLHEKLWTTGFAISGTAACCLDSTGWVQAFAAAAFIAGLAIVGTGFLKRKRACHRPKLHAQNKNFIN